MQYLIENVGSLQANKAKRRLTGVLAIHGKLNSNNRFYSSGLMEREISRLNRLLKANPILGSLDHPDCGEDKLSNSSHIVESIQFNHDGTVTGSLKLLAQSPSANLAKELITENVKLGVSLRGTGSLKTVNGIQVVQDDFKLITFDIVANPSSRNYATLAESAENRLNAEFAIDDIDKWLLDRINSSGGSKNAVHQEFVDWILGK